MNPIEIREIRPSEITDAASVIARAMAGNPNHVRDFGPDPGLRLRRCERFYGAVLPMIRDHGLVLGAYRDGSFLGGLGASLPGHCEVPPAVQLRLAARFLAGLGVRSTVGLVRWMKAREAYDPMEPHWHVGPVAVEPTWQGRGVGSALLSDFRDRIGVGRPAFPCFLETESERNVRLYERFGFTTIRELDVLGVRTWAMIADRPEGRPVESAGSSPPTIKATP
ncbi:GNAT family N-acetyltransferase [Aquisphaera insulae]|uniref:GNAT family N-acetyltransferase n=1 Tax=Aquisphaera insulae TaxID=2712864 RepID=UPI0013EB5E8F|nr:GNAT family N-acetyltransferase [Aquisphaera insulae]